MYNKYCNTVLMNYWDITHTHCLLKRSLMRSHPVSGNSGLPMCCGKVCAEVLSDACTQGSVNPRRALRGPRCEPPGPFASVPPHKSCCLAVHINKLLNQRMRETRPEGMRAFMHFHQEEPSCSLQIPIPIGSIVFHRHTWWRKPFHSLYVI